MIKALDKNLQIRMSGRMYKSIEALAANHSTTASRIIRAGLWIFLSKNGEQPKRPGADGQAGALCMVLDNLDRLDAGISKF